MNNNTLSLRITANAAQFSQVLKSAARDVDNFAKNSSGRISTITKTAGNMANGIMRSMKYIGAAALGGAFGVNQFVKQASTLQSVRASFESMTGSAENARKVMKQLNDFSFETAFSAEDINRAAQMLLGAGLNVESLGAKMQQLGDIAGATGANLGQLTLPVSQAMAKGKLDTQDYYQILNSGAGKIGQVLREEVASRGLGDIMDAMSKGKVTSEILFAAMEKAAAQGGFAFEGAKKQAETYEGRMSNLAETINNVGLEILGVDKATGEVDPDGLFARMSDRVKEATKWLEEHKEEIKKVAQIIIDNLIPALTLLVSLFLTLKVISWTGNIISGITTVLGIMSKIPTVASALATGVPAAFSLMAKGVTTALSLITAHPIVAAIVAIIGVLIFLQAKFDIFGKALRFIGDIAGQASETLSGVFSAIGEKVGEVIDFIAPIIEGVVTVIMGFASGIITFFVDVFTTIVDTVSPVVDFISGIFSTVWQVISGIFIAIVAVVAMMLEGIYNLFVGLVGGIMGAIGPIIGFFAGIFNTIVGIVSAAISVVVNIIGTIIGFVSGVVNSVMGVITPIISWITNVIINPIVGFFTGMWNMIVGGVRWFINAAMSVILPIVNWINGTIIQPVARFFSGLWDGVVSGINGAINGIRNVMNTIIGIIKAPINGVIGLINGVIDGINKLKVPDWVPGLGGASPNIPKIPKLATGGIVAPVNGGQIIYAGDGGQNEWVVPESKMASLVGQLNQRAGTQQAAPVNLNIEVNVDAKDSGFSESDAISIAKQIAGALRSQGLNIEQMGALR